MNAQAHPRTLFDKVWQNHVVRPAGPLTPTTLYIDLHLVHEVTSPQAFAELDQRGIQVRRPGRTLATMDHAIPTREQAGQKAGSLRVVQEEQAARQVAALERNCARHGIQLLDLADHRQGIVHVIGPELGATQPGFTIVCGDSHTSTHGAFGAIAFGIGSSEVAQVLATQCLLAEKPPTLAVETGGRLPAGVAAKDLILALIARFGVAGATGYAVEYRGPAIAALSMEERMTVCNMSIEWGARVGMIAPDETTFSYLEGRPLAPRGAAFAAAVERWRTLPSENGATFDRTLLLDASALAPMITWGTHPGMGMAIDAPVPEPNGDATTRRALEYMQLEPGRPLLGRKIDVVFIGSCTNGRLSDLQAAARLLEGRKVAPGVRALIVPGSGAVRQAAEDEGLGDIFRAAGAEWRQAGCSMCLAMNDDRLAPGEYAVSTSNRNFEGRQGPGGRTFLASPATAAACAVAGHIADPREVF